MNCYYISTIICVIVIVALILMNIMGDYVAKKQNRKCEEQLNEFRNEANKTKQDLDILLNLAMQNVGHGKRHRRQALGFYGRSDAEEAAEPQMVPNCNLDICKNENCGKVWYSDFTKDSLKPIKQLNKFLSSLNADSKKMPREIHSLAGESNNDEENAWKSAEEMEGIVREETKAENKEANGIANKQNNRSKGKSKAKINSKGCKVNKFSWSENEEENKFPDDENLKENSNIFDEDLNIIRSSADADYLNSDVSSCQHCSQNAGNGILKNNFKSNKLKSIDSYGNESQNPKYLTNFSKKTKKLEAQQPFLKSFEQKYSIEDPENDDGEEEENSLHQIKYPSVTLTRSQQENESPNRNCKPIASNGNTRNKGSLNATQLVLNDQLENGKNNLSHEANYKLSKNEQEASESKKGFSWKWGIFKRSHPFNAMSEIKLKTSRRLMQKGFGASLPSYSLGETREDIMIDNMLKRKEKEILKEKNRKNKHFEESLKNNELDDAAEKSLEDATGSRSFKNWSSIRQKRISYPNARYKREQRDIQDKGATKAFNKSISRLENNLALSVNGNNLRKTAWKAPLESNKSVNAQSNKKLNSFTASTVTDNTKEQQEGDTYNDIKSKPVKALDIESSFASQLKESKLFSSTDQARINNNYILNSENLPLKTSSLKLKMEDLKAQNYYLSCYKPLKRIKRTTGRKPSQIKASSNKKPKQTLNKTKITRKYDKSFYTTNKYFGKTGAFKISQRAKHFDPTKTLQLKIYKKFHTPKALKHTEMKGKSNAKRFKYHQRERSLEPTFAMAKSSAGSESFMTAATKSLWRKARHIKKNIKDFFKFMKNLPIQKSVTNLFINSQEYKEKIQQKAFDATKSQSELKESVPSEKTQKIAFDTLKSCKTAEAKLHEEENLTKPNTINQEIKIDISNNFNKIRNPKLRFLKDGASNFFLLKTDLKNYNIKNFKELKKLRPKRAGHNLKALSENYKNSVSSILNTISNSGEHNLNIFKSFWAGESDNVIHKSSLEAFLGKMNAFISFFKTLFSYSQLNGLKSFLNYRNSFLHKNSSNIDKSFTKQFQSCDGINAGNKNSAKNYSTESTLTDLLFTKILNSKSFHSEKSFTCSNSNGKFNKLSTGNSNNNTTSEQKLYEQNKEKASKSFIDKSLGANIILIKSSDEQPKDNHIKNKIFKEKLHQVSSRNKSYNGKLKPKTAFDIHRQKLAPTIRFNESFTPKKLNTGKQVFKDDNLEIYKNLNRTLSFQLYSDNLNDSKSSFKILQGKSEPQQFIRNMKRSKRALNKDLQEDHMESEKIKHFNKRSYLFRHGDLYNTDIGNEAKRIYQQIPQPIAANNFQKLFHPQQFNNLKTNYPAVKKFEPRNFDYMWLDSKPRKKHDQNSQIKHRNLKTSRKRHNSEHSKNSLTENKTKERKDPYLSELSDFNKNYKFNENMFNWSTVQPKPQINAHNNSSDDHGKLSLELQDKILNCKEFSNLEEFIKSLPKNLTQSLLGVTTESNSDPFTGKIEMEINTSIITNELETTEEPLIIDSTVKCSTTTEEQIVNEHTETSIESTEEFTQPDDTEWEHTSESSSQDDDSDKSTTDSTWENVTTDHKPTAAEDREDIKLNITIKANVHSNPPDNHYFGNGTFDVIRALMDDRKRRNIEHPHQRPHAEENNEELNDLMSGKLSSKIVDNIFNSVQQSPHLKALWPSLKRDRPEENKAQPPNFYAIRNQQNEEQLQNSEKLLDQVMSSLNTIIEQQARAKACVPLRPDLQEFYGMILQSRQQQDMIREKRHPTEAEQRKVSNYNIPSLDTNQIEQETKIVKKLLKKYDELPPEDQQQVAAVRDDLIKNLIVLHRLQDNEVERDSRDRRENAWDVSDEEILKSLQSQYSPEFLKLLDAAELYREINSD